MITKQELIDIMKEGWQQTGYYSVDFNANMVADKILNAIIKHEQDIVKEFVEWLKVKYQKECKAWFEIAKEKEKAKNKWEKSKANCYFGRSYGFDRVATDLEQDLENFLKERE